MDKDNPNSPITKHGNTGYTIIEILIVLCVASLILLIVLLAVSSAKRMERNHERKHVVNTIIAEMGHQFEYTGSTQFPKESQISANCKMIEDVVSQFVGGITNCDSSYQNRNGGQCLIATTELNYTVCVLHRDTGPHDYMGEYDDIIIQVGHWCIKDGAPIDPRDTSNPNNVVTSEHGVRINYGVISVRTKLENNINYCQDYGRPVASP